MKGYIYEMCMALLFAETRKLGTVIMPESAPSFMIGLESPQSARNEPLEACFQANLSF